MIHGTVSLSSDASFQAVLQSGNPSRPSNSRFPGNSVCDQSDVVRAMADQTKARVSRRNVVDENHCSSCHLGCYRCRNPDHHPLLYPHLFSIYQGMFTQTTI